MWYVMAKLGVWPAATVVKVDDTAPGIGEGRSAGTWTVGIALTGNTVGLSAEELAALTSHERTRFREHAARELDADMMIDSISDLPQAITEIDARFAVGERPRVPGNSSRTKGWEPPWCLTPHSACDVTSSSVHLRERRRHLMTDHKTTPEQ
jgi:hypothetical protein